MRLIPLLGVLVAASLGTALSGGSAPLTFDPAASRVEVVVKATVDSFTGRLEKFEPEVTLGADGQIATARLRFRFADVKTGKEKRDRAMHEWQQTDRFPDGEFELATLTPAPDGRWLATGRLTFHGQTRPLDFPVTLKWQGPAATIDGEAQIDTREFGLPVIRMMGLLKVDPLVLVRFHLEGKKEATP
ncbi:YceI-like domain protein [Lacunisphaera limnophila]|uniref:YceI-like domain protein n=1 Tax=Lacunisphaera limnophila TaxID=1838286 RepID=A0A1D8AZV2_9BACT|nr:YceI family protein [Lacunisphaera limnophila]AOS46397.1 YceI-like domain protein [Lacunisphaera limnophila]